MRLRAINEKLKGQPMPVKGKNYFTGLRAPELYNKAYLPLLDDTTKFLHLFGSAGSGKSRFEAQKEIWKSFDPKRKNRRTLVIRKVATTLKDSVYKELNTVISDQNLGDQFEVLKSPLSIVNKQTGVQFLFIGLDDVEKVKSISGVDRIWIEEATELTEKKELDQLRLRLRGFDEVQITLSYNPINEHHWLNKEIHEVRPNNHRIFKSTYKDNEKLLEVDPDYAVDLESLKDSNPNYYRVYVQGNWGQVSEGLIYTDFDVVPAMGVDGNGIGIQFYGLDFGFSDPLALIAMRVEDAKPKKNLICQEILYESNLDAPEMVKRFAEIGVKKNVKIIGDSSRPEMIKSLRNAGYNCLPSTKGAGSVLTGINRVRAFNLQVVAGSKNIIKELQNYQKKKIQGIWVEEPATNQVDHALDAIRYGEQATSKPKVVYEHNSYFSQNNN